jgi:hypothetical protein
MNSTIIASRCINITIDHIRLQLHDWILTLGVPTHAMLLGVLVVVGTSPRFAESGVVTGGAVSRA